MKEGLKLYDVVEKGVRPCEVCLKPHNGVVVELKDGKAHMVSWAARRGSGHPYKPVSWEVYAKILSEGLKNVKVLLRKAYKRMKKAGLV